jgi:hypothetical protein
MHETLISAIYLHTQGDHVIWQVQRGPDCFNISTRIILQYEISAIICLKSQIMMCLQDSSHIRAHVCAKSDYDIQLGNMIYHHLV